MAQTYTLNELAELVRGEVIGDGEIRIGTVNAIDLAGPGELTFLVNAKQADKLRQCRASACIVPEPVDGLEMAQIVVPEPDLAEAIIHNHLLAEPFTSSGIHASSVIGDGCTISDQVSIGPLVVVGDRVGIGDRVTIHPGVVIEDDVQIGDDCVLHAGAKVARGCILGNRVVLFHGAVIGSDGFGFATDRTTGRHVSKPQVGIVRLDDDVQIGANSCVDRAAFGVTHLKQGVRLDNQVMIGHNVVIGENSILVAQSGIAGSTTLGRNVILASKAGVADHLKIGNQVVVAAMGGVHNDQPDGAIVGGIPAIDVKAWGRAAAAFRRLPDMLRQLRKLSRQVEALGERRKLDKKNKE